MSYKTDYKIEGFFEYVVPPLEGFWWQGEQHPVYAEMRTDRIDRRENVKGIDCSNKDTFNWISVIRLPDFITKKRFCMGGTNSNQEEKNRLFTSRVFND